MMNTQSSISSALRAEMQKIVDQMAAANSGGSVTADALRGSYGSAVTGGPTGAPTATADQLRNLYGSNTGGGNPSAPVTGTVTPAYDYPSYEDYYQSAGYQAAQAAQQKVLQEAIGRIVSNVQQQKQSVEQQAAEAARQAYIGYMQSKNTLPQVLAAKGYHGGLADSYQVGLETNLQNNQNQIALNKANTLSQLEQAALNAQSQASRESAEKQADIALAASNAWNSYVAQLNSLANTNYWKQLEADASAAQTAAASSGSSSSGSSKPFQWVMDMIDGGILPDNNIINLSVLTAAERKQLEELIAQM